MSETKKYSENLNQKNIYELIRNIKDPKNSIYYKDGEKTKFDELENHTRKVMIFIAKKPILIRKLFNGKYPDFEKFVQKESGFTQDITSKNFSKEALYKYFRKFLEQNNDDKFHKYFNENLNKIEVEINGKKYPISRIIFEIVYPYLVDTYKIVNGIKKELNELNQDIK